MKKTEIMMHCPNCGAEIPAKSAACPECGSDERTGWSQQTYLDGIDLGDMDEDEYETMRDNEFAGGAGRRSRPVLQILMALLLLIAFLLMLLRSYIW